MAIETLLISGANNHDWKRSSPFCRDLMQNTGMFNVKVTENPAETLADRAALSKYQLFFFDYNGPDWPENVKKNFIDAVQSGVGVCVLHAANNGFKDWKEFEELCALMWREGTGHGDYHKFEVKFTDREHPITKGLPPVIKDHPDELYANLVHMHNTPYHIIATAYSNPKSRGTGKDEPALIVKTYGKGHVFHCILGHVWEGGCMDTFNNTDFQRVLLRGCEWAATGKVKS